jgi:uncharacterized protein (TIGR04255 family)
MSLDNLYPHAGNHSIQNAILAVEWGSQLTILQLELLRDAARTALSSYSRVEEQRSIVVNIGPDPSQIPAQVPELSGFTFSRTSTDGQIEKQAQITRAHCLFVVSDYSRWAALVAEVRALLDMIAPTLANHSIQIAAVGLQYSDRFVWRGETTNLNLSEVFRADSPFIASNGLTCTEAWHSHYGYFVNSSSPIQHKRLDNINLNIADEPQGRAIQILTSHRALLTTPLSGDNIPQSVMDLETELHSVNKHIFRQLLTNELLAKIQLGNKSRTT